MRSAALRILTLYLCFVMPWVNINKHGALNSLKDHPLDHPPAMSEIHYYHHGRFRVAGGVLPDAFTAYQTFGDPKNPCIVFPTCYGGRLDSKQAMSQGHTDA